MKPASPRGYALMVVLTISLVLAIGISTLLTSLAAAERNSGRLRLNREAYYVCDGVGRVISKTTSDVLADSRFDSASATSGLEDLLMDRVEAIHGRNLSTLLRGMRQRYELDGVDGFLYRDVDVNTSFGQVGIGRFAGLNGQRRTFTYDLALRREGGSTCRTTATVDTVRVPLSEIAFFSTEDVSLCPTWVANDVSRRARYHVNGDLVVGTQALPRTTVTGSITAGCGAPFLTVCPSIGPCVSSGGGSSVSAASSSSRRRALTVADLFADGDRGTSPLKYPRSLARTQSSDFADVAGVADPDALENEGSLRYLIDPVAPGDDGAAQNNRLAALAQIRIIDGVWYLNDGTWPGEPVWSDHPTVFPLQTADSPDEHTLVGRGNLQVGQAALFSSSTVPRRYSYYRTGGMPSSGRPVVSYGELVKVADHWEPGRGTSLGDPLGRAAAAAKSGFGDAHTFRQSHLGDPGRVLPINIDLAALHAALDSVDDNELGARLQQLSDLPGLSGLADRSRIIVWVTSTWSGSQEGLQTTSSRPAPRPAYVGCGSSDPADCETTATSIDFIQAPFPYPMCRRDTASDRGCDLAAARRPNAVRVFNGSDAFASGRMITIATPLPLYVLGSMDRGTGSAAAAPVGLPGEGKTVLAPANTPSLFFAADTVTLLSDHWNDGDTWQNPDSLVNPDAAALANPPIYNASILTGRYVVRSTAMTPFGGERAVRFLERWPATSVSTSPIITGSVHVGFRAVHQTAAACYDGGSESNCATASPWRHYWSEALAAETVAPPGMPAFTLRGVGETVPDSMHLNLGAFLAMLRARF